MFVSTACRCRGSDPVAEHGAGGSVVRAGMAGTAAERWRVVPAARLASSHVRGRLQAVTFVNSGCSVCREGPAPVSFSPVATTERDFYLILGVERSATDADIKRAFRKLAQQWHPDVNTDPAAHERFKEINEAYQVLSDPERRQRYDMFGRAGVDGGAGGRRRGRLRGVRRLLRHLRRVLRWRRRRPPRRGAVDRSPAPTCATTCGSRSRRRSRAPRRRSSSPSSQPCETCHGSGAKAGSEPITCPQCNGRGEVRSVRQTMLGQMVNVSACPRCHGEGKIIETPCETCHGDGRTERKRTLRVTIPAGIDEGHQIRLSNEGEVGPRGGPPGSLYVAVHVLPHPSLVREGTELFYEAKVSIAQAALGTRITVPTVEGEEEVEIKAGTQPDSEIRLRGRGVPHLRRSGQRGDLHVLVDVVVPTKLSKKQRELLAAYAEESGEAVGHGGGLLEKLGAGLSHDGAAGAGAWLELAVEADVEAVEAVSEILGRAAPGGTLGRARVRADRRGPGRPARPDPAGHRPRLPAGPRPSGRRPRRGRGGRGARPPPGVRPAPDRRAADPGRRRGRLGRSLEGVLPGPARRAASRHPADLAAPSPRARRRRPRARSGHGLRDRAPSDDAPVPRGHGGAGGPRRARRRRASSTSGAARGSWPSPPCGSGRPRRSGSTPIRSPSRRRPPTPGATGSCGGFGRASGASRAASRRSTSCSPTSSPGCWCRWRPALRDEVRPGRHAPGVGHLRRPRGGGPRGVRGRRPARREPAERGRLGRPRSGPSGVNAGPGATIGCDAVLFPDPAGRAHHPRGQPGPALHPPPVRAADAAGGGRVGKPRGPEPALGAEPRHDRDRPRAGADRHRARRVARLVDAPAAMAAPGA